MEGKRLLLLAIAAGHLLTLLLVVVINVVLFLGEAINLAQLVFRCVAMVVMPGIAGALVFFLMGRDSLKSALVTLIALLVISMVFTLNTRTPERQPVDTNIREQQEQNQREREMNEQRGERITAGVMVFTQQVWLMEAGFSETNCQMGSAPRGLWQMAQGCT